MGSVRVGPLETSTNLYVMGGNCFTLGAQLEVRDANREIREEMRDCREGRSAGRSQLPVERTI